MTPYIFPGIGHTKTSIINTVAGVYGIPLELIYKKTNKRESSEPRMIFMVFSKPLCRLSDSGVTLPFMMSHCAYHHARKTIGSLWKSNKTVREKVLSVGRNLGLSDEQIVKIVKSK